MSSYWKKKLDELEQSKAKTPAKTTSSDYWGSKLTELQSEKKNIAPVKTTMADVSNRIIGADKNDLNSIKLEVSDLEEKSNRAKELSKRISEIKYSIQASKYGSGRNGWNYTKVKEKEDNEKLALAEAEYNNYLAEIGYKSLDELKGAYTEKKAYYKKAKYDQEGAKLATVSNEADFSQITGKGLAKDIEFGEKKRKRNYGKAKGTRGSIDKYYAAKMALDERYGSLEEGTGKYENQVSFYRNMTDEEFKIFEYHLIKDEKNGTSNAKKYIDKIEQDLEVRKAKKKYDETADKSKIAKVIYSGEVGLDQFASGMENVFNTEDEYIPVSSTQLLGSMYREDLGEHGAQLSENLGGASTWQMAYDIGQTTSNMVPSILASAAVGTISKTAGAALGATLIGTSAAGNSYQEMLNNGYDKEQARTYSTLVGVAEAGLSYALGGISKLGGTITGKGISKAVSGITNGFLRYSAELGMHAVSEGFEEAAQEALAPVFENIALGYKKNTLEDTDWSQIAYSALLGGITGGLIEGVTGGKTNAALTENEQKVVDKVYEAELAKEEADGKKLTSKEKKKLYDTVLNDLEKGYISTDTIEEVLGGEDYTAYKNTLESEEALQNEFDELNKMKQGEMTGEQIDRRAELKEQLAELKETSNKDTLKSQLNDNVFNIVKDSKLAESYAEKSRRGQAFEADLSQYEEKYRGTVKKAVESGILNNTRRTHEMVDFVAKISADKGVLFDFADNEKIKNSSYAVDGKTVNGFVNENGDVVLNINSAKSLNSTAGHEITHILEGTELYDTLAQTITDYAKTKGDYQGRIEALNKLYEGVYKGEDFADKVNKELVADLVGDYIFTDKDFVRKLSTENRNIFEKIYDEIKYLCKVATAGSKEARELEKVKRTFAEVYRESGKAKDTKYSISDKHITDNSTGYADGETYYTMSYKQDGKVVGTLEYGEYEGQPNVKMIEVIPEYRRKGIGTKLLQELQKKYADQEIDFGMATPDGTKLIDSVTYDVTDEKVVADRKKLKDLQTELNELQEKLDILYDTENLTEAQEAEMHKLGDRWEEVYQSINKLEPTLRGKRATKTFVKTDAKYSLSAEQETYFKDSKVRDENGNLKVMYHGTSGGGFTVFDTYGSNYGLFGQGSYFTDNKSIAESYTKKGKGENKQVYESYLNITNPMDMDGQADAEAWAKQFPDALFPESGTNEDFYRAMEDYLADEMYSKWEAAEIAIDGIQGMGYDGITHIGGGRVNKNSPRHRVYIAFEPEQIKNIDNVKPTSNPDIRYSLSEADNTYLSAVEKGDMETAQKMVDEAASEWSNGNDIYIVDEETGEAQFKFYRSYDGGRTVWNTHGNNQNQGVFLTSDEYIADAFDNSMGVPHGQTSGKHITVYAKAKNPFEIDAEGQIYTSIPVYEDSSPDWLYEMSISDIEWSDEENDYISVDSVDIDRLYPEAFKRGYDAVIVKNVKEGVGGGTATDVVLKDGGTQMKSADPVTYDDNGNVIPLSQRFNTENEDIRFSLSEPVEETKDLLVLHNLSESKLLKQLELDGFPMPSLAVTNQPHTNFGSISILFDKETIDPKKNKKNKTYSADAWTPTFPRIEYETDSNISHTFFKTLRGLIDNDYYNGSVNTFLYDVEDNLNRNGGYEGFVDYLAGKPAIQYAFLKSKGENIEIAQKQKEIPRGFSSDERWISRYEGLIEDFSGDISKLGQIPYTELVEQSPTLKNLLDKYPYKDKMRQLRLISNVIDGAKAYQNYNPNAETEIEYIPDYSQTDKDIAARVDKNELKDWLKNQTHGIVANSGVYNGKDVYTPSGQRRSFKQLHYPVTVENIVKSMASQGEKSVTSFHGVKTLRATTAQTFKSIAEIQKAKGKLQNLSEEEVNKIHDELSSEMYDVFNKIISENPDIFRQNDIFALDTIGEVLSEVEYENINASYIKGVFKKYNYNISTETADDCFKLLDAISSMPVNIFEAKPQRVVRYDEIKAVVIPDNTSIELKNALTERGINFVEYDGTEADRQAKLKDVAAANDSYFSLSDPNEAPTKNGNFNIYGKDIALEKPIAPVKETVTDSALPENYAPVTEDEANATARESLETLTDADAPPETNSVYDELPDTTPIDDKTLKSIADTLKDTLYLNDKEAQAIQDVVQRYSTAEFPSEEELFDEIKREFGEKVWTEQNEEIAEVKKLLHSYRINVSPQIKNDIADYGYFHRHHFGKIRFAKDGIAVDTAYQELSEMYPQFFPADITNPTDQLWQIAEVTEMATDTEMSDMLDDETIQEAVAIISAEVGKYKESATMAEAEQSASEYLKQIAPLKKPKAEKAYEAIRPQPEKQPKLIRVKDADTEQHTAEVLTDEPKVERKQRGLWSRLVMNFFDKAAPFEKLAIKTKNRALDGKFNFMRYSDTIAQRVIGKGTNGVKALKDIQSSVEKDGLTKKLYEYLYHKHNVDRMTLADRYEGVENKPVFGGSVTAEMSRKAAAKLEAENPKLIEYANDIYTYNKNLRKQLVDGGVISQETADLWEEMYPHYVPTRRVGDEGLNINVPLDTGRTGVNAPVKRATGGSRDILPLFDTMAQRTIQTYKAVAKNRFGVELKNTLGTTIERAETSLDEVLDGIDAHEELLQEGKDGRSPTFTVFENGEKVTFEITDEMYDALKPTSEGLAYTNKVANTVGNIHRGLLTEYNPVFLFTNAIKDSQDVLINSQHPVRTYANFPRAVAELLGKKGKWYNEYMENGGEQNTYFDKQANTFEKDKSGIVKWLGKIGEANNFIERIPRLAEYIASRKKGASVEVAMLDAARVTTNFAAGGDVTKALNRNGFTFLNASVQGAMQQVRNVREAKANGLKGVIHLAAKVALAGLPAMLLNRLLWDDDEDYEELSDYVKDNYYIVAKYGDGQFVRIPKGRTMAVIQEAFEQVGNALTGNDEVDLNNFLELAISNLAPNNPLDNNIIAPVTQVLRNETWYGDDLVPTRLQDLPAAEQYDESTDAISKWLGEKLNISPYKLNYLLNQYSGGVGDVVMPMLTPEAERGDNSLSGNIVAPFKDKFSTNSTMNNQTVSDFYDTIDELTKNAKSSKATDEDILKYKYMNSVNADLGELYGKKREIQNNSGLTDKEKYNQVKDIQKQINSLAKESLNTYNNVSMQDGYASIGNLHYKVNKDGEWEKITDKQYDKQEKVTSGLGISASEYWGNKEEYDYAYENPEKYALAKSVGGYESYKSYTSDLWDIKADKDSSGKSISGSRKAKVADYINNLDADYGEKIILFKSEYNADDTYNYEIIDYLNNREDISYDEMVAILKELGFTVKSDGSIYWD